MAATEGCTAAPRVVQLAFLFAMAACADARTPRPGSGLTVTPAGPAFEGNRATQEPSPEGGAPSVTARCIDTATFSAVAQPWLNTHCARCHNGTKGRATARYDLTTVTDLSAATQQRACDATLSQADPSLGEAAPLFAEVNPDDTRTVHDFKFATSEQYAAFRREVRSWLSRE